MVANPFIPDYLVGRQEELKQICQILASDGDLLLAGVPGSGRRTLLRFAAHAVDSRVVEIDCLRATDSRRFLQLLAEGILSAFQSSSEIALIRRWSLDQPIVLEQSTGGRSRLVWHTPSKDEWSLFQALLALPQAMAESLGCRVVLVFLNFPHIRSWDRSEKWQTYLRQEIQQQSRVSYALIATVAERWVQHSNMQVVFLGPLNDEDLHVWVVNTLAAEGLEFEPDGTALELFLRYVQGHFGDAIALARRIWLDYRSYELEKGIALDSKPPSLIRGQERVDQEVAFSRDRSIVDGQPIQVKSALYSDAYHSTFKPTSKRGVIQAHHVHRSALTLVEDLSVTFESLILLLPPSQVRVLESLALDPTSSPHSREYIQKHQLSRGGGLQGALASLEQKGLVYGSEYGYRITLPLLSFWLTQRLS